ncbi:MAG: TrkH family potassium uptake protein [Thermodesulfobacteriota bacterium]
MNRFLVATNRKFRQLPPAATLVGGFVLAILAGAGFLLLPAATVSGSLSFMDALFTATSAVCVTGLIVVDTGGYYTLFGQIVILVLIQIGGLGVMTVSVTIFRLVGASVSLRQRLAIQDIFAHTPRRDIFQLVKTIFLFTALAELSGAVLLFLIWRVDYPWPRAAYLAVFHSISAFCNAGFSLFAGSLMDYRGHLLLNGVVCALIVLGGLGFPVLHDLFSQARVRGNHRRKLTVQTKTVLLTTAVLISGGATLFWYLERPNTLGGASPLDSVLVSVFQAVTCRTAGFNTVDTSLLRDPTLALMIFLMFIGASPGSCGGGVKTTTLALLGALVWSRLRHKVGLNLFYRSIPQDTVSRSLALVLISLGLIGLVAFLVLMDSPANPSTAGDQRRFLACLFETFSAFGTVGLSMGATPALTAWGKFWIILMMLTGRVGVLTFAYLLTGTGRRNGLEYAEENLMIG